MKVVVLGDTGMLGGMLKRFLEDKKDIEVVGLSRKDDFIVDHYSPVDELMQLIPNDVDYIVNCIGAIKPVFNDKKRLTNAIFTNAVFPRELANICELDGINLIHITTDCVFDGLDGGYTEKSVHNPTDMYGKSKSLGEPENCMVLRTSIIGPEWNGNKRSLVSWFLNTGNANGYDNHIWNGLTTLELSRCIYDIITNELYSGGTYHLFSNDVTKYELLRIMESWWKRGTAVNKTSAPWSCNRTLRTVKNLNSILKPNSINFMIGAIRKYIVPRRNSKFDEPLAVYPIERWKDV